MKKWKYYRLCVLGLVVLAAVLLVHLSVLAADVFGIFQKSGPYTIGLSQADANAKRVSVILKEAKVIKSPFLFRTVAKLKGVDDRFYAATFTFDTGDGYNAIINTLTYDSGYRTTDITVPEGSTVKDIRAIVVSTGYVTEEEFDVALAQVYDYPFLEGIERENKLEGYLFPDTYNIANTMEASEILSLMLDRFAQVYTDEYRARAEALGYTDDEILTLASLIEGEAGSQNDRTRVSAVFHNRLDRPSEFLYLQSCASVQYILGEKKPILSIADTQIDSPYNTYRYTGLPIGPICNPGKAAIEAALYPAETDDLYFQSDAEGKIYYAKTLEEHEKLKSEIQGD